VTIDGTTEGASPGTMGIVLTVTAPGAADGLVLRARLGRLQDRGARDRDFDLSGHAGVRVQSDDTTVGGIRRVPETSCRPPFGLILNGPASGGAVQGNLIGTDNTGANRPRERRQFAAMSAPQHRDRAARRRRRYTIAFGGIDGIEIDSGTGIANPRPTRSSRTPASLRRGSASTSTATTSRHDPGDGDTGANNDQNFPT